MMMMLLLLLLLSPLNVFSQWTWPACSTGGNVPVNFYPTAPGIGLTCDGIPAGTSIQYKAWISDTTHPTSCGTTAYLGFKPSDGPAYIHFRGTETNAQQDVLWSSNQTGRFPTPSDGSVQLYWWPCKTWDDTCPNPTKRDCLQNAESKMHSYMVGFGLYV